MKRIVYLVMIVATLFAGCKKNVDPTIGNTVTVTNEKVTDIDPTSVKISGTYSYLSNLDEIYVLVSASSDMTDAKAVESVLNGWNFTTTITELKGDTKYYYRYRYVSMGGSLESTDVKGFTTSDPFNGHDYVDLGLPSGLLWATCNVGANNPEDYGDYFAWGEVTTKDTYKWNTYKWCNGSSSILTKYNTDSSYGTVDDKTVLELVDDAARANWGGSWRLPTKSEMEELINNCTWTWTTMGSENGYRIANKSDNNKYIFLPAAGYYNESYLYSPGSFGGFWSSSLYTSDSNKAYYLNFNSGPACVIYYNRYRGQSVRPVCLLQN